MQQNKNTDLGKGNVGGLLFHLAVPAITAQIINVLYNLVDRMYIGHIAGVGADALTGVGVTLPLIIIISAFASLVSMGGAPRTSIMLGQGKKDDAEKTLGNCTTLLIIISLILTPIFLIFGDKMLMLFGASENTLPYASDYMRIYTLGTIFVQLSLGLNAFITSQGFAITSMLSVLIGAVVNIILDPVFIFGFHMGVKGAALATIISQAISAAWVIKFLTGSKTVLKIKTEHLALSAKTILPCIALGLSPFTMQVTESVITICFNASLQKYGGDLAVGAMTILSSVMQFASLPLIGLSQGAQPIISYNFGARNQQRVKSAFGILLKSSLFYSLLLWLIAMTTPQVFVKLFTDNAKLIDFSVWAIRIFMGSSCLLGVQNACQQTFIALGNAKTSLFLAVFRKIILLIPLIFCLPYFLKDNIMAVFLAEPVADFIAVVVTTCLFFVQFRKALHSISDENNPLS